MARRLTLPDIDPNVVIELGKGDKVSEFKMKIVTLAVEEELEDVQEEMDRVAAASGSKPLDRMEAQVKQLDVLFEEMPRPAGDVDAVGRPKTPTEALIAPYKDGKVTARQINSLIGQMMEAARPT